MCSYFLFESQNTNHKRSGPGSALSTSGSWEASVCFPAHHRPCKHLLHSSHIPSVWLTSADSGACDPCFQSRINEPWPWSQKATSIAYLFFPLMSEITPRSLTDFQLIPCSLNSLNFFQIPSSWPPAILFEWTMLPEGMGGRGQACCCSLLAHNLSLHQTFLFLFFFLFWGRVIPILILSCIRKVDGLHRAESSIWKDCISLWKCLRDHD